jgi:stage II sporulation protein R
MKSLKNIRTINIALAAALCFSILMSIAGFDAHCDEIRSSVLRLHILANSDSSEDQALKLSVRDRIIEKSGELFESAVTRDDAIAAATENIALIKSVAEQEISRMGYDYPVTVKVEPAEFNTRIYGDVTLPAGTYTAVRVLIGKAEGKNWWCVMFPQMCLSAAQGEMSDVIDGTNLDIVENSDKYEVRLKTVELYEQIKSWFD